MGDEFISTGVRRPAAAGTAPFEEDDPTIHRAALAARGDTRRGAA